MDAETDSGKGTTRAEGGCDGKITYQQALECCLSRMEAGSGLRFEKDLRKKIGDLAIEKFKHNHRKWPELFEKVLRSARKIGEYAEEFAVFDAEINGQPFPKEVKEKHVMQAIRVVRELCPAALREDEKRFVWCPEP